MIWRKVKESNPRPRGRPGFRGRLRTTAHHLPYMSWLSRRDLNARPRFQKTSPCAELRERRSCAELWDKYAQEDSNLQPRSSPELTTGISRPLCQLSYGRKHNFREMVRAVGFEPTASCFQGRSSGLAELHPVLRHWRSVGRSNPSRPIDSRAASPDA